MLLVCTDWHETNYTGFFNVDIEINGEKNETYKLNMSELNVVDGTLSDLLIKALKDLTRQIDQGIKMR